MYIKNAGIEIPDDDPFKNDALERFENARTLTDLIRTITQPFVLSITSPWGTGKTTFILMWEKYLKNNAYEYVHFNAWENQSEQDPLISFMAEINQDIVKGLGDKGAKARAFFEQARRVGGVILRRSIPAIAKLATHGVLDLDKVSEDVLATAVSKLANDEVEQYQSRSKSMAQFKKHLEGFVRELNSLSDPPKPVVFFIDELDRCKPMYVIDLLERLHHLFNIPGMVVVLALDKDQLSHSVRSIYGQNAMDTDGYLRRFIDLDYRLPIPSAHNYCRYLCTALGLDDLFQRRNRLRQEFFALAPRLVEVFGLSLRTQEQCLSQLSISRLTRWGGIENFLCLTALVFLKAVNESLYYEFVQRKTSRDSVVRFYESKAVTTKEPEADHVDNTIKALFIAMSSTDAELNEEILRRRQASADDPGGMRREMSLMRPLELLQQARANNSLDYLASKLELLEPFTTP